ncbi:MAG: selenocysteine-specific translation elongation factor [Anaerolineaceae bacterium]
MRVVGTAGHVDHGKSTLVAALTGTNPDRLKEEQARQMTIELGFAWLTLPGGEEVGIVDVPGHRDFIENMLAGVGGIDATLFVIAADEGVMPQTREHLAIIDLLQVQSGLIVLTKTDLIDDPDWLALVEGDVKQLAAGTVLESAPVLRVSARTGAGIKELKAALEECLQQHPSRPDLGRPRLPIDRVFSIAGFGTVVTGTLSDGHLRQGNEIEILPGGPRGRIRGLQSHKHKEEIASPGSRTAVNISGIEVEQVTRGQVLTHPGVYQSTQRLDAYFRLVRDASGTLKHSTEVKFFLGAAEVVARVRLLGVEEIKPGEEGWLQLELRTPVVAVRGDRYILRRPSPGETLGGGVVVDPHPAERHKRFSEGMLAGLNALRQGTPAEVMLQASLNAGDLPVRELVNRTRLSQDQVHAALQELLQSNQLVLLEPGQVVPNSDLLVIARSNWVTETQRALQEVEQFHRSNPLRGGMPKEELKSRLRMSPRLFTAAMRKWINDGLVKEQGAFIYRQGFEVRFSVQQQALVIQLLNKFALSPFSPPSIKECQAEVGDEVYGALVDQGQLIPVSGEVVFRRQDYDALLQSVREHFIREHTLTVAQFRDRFNTSRRYALAFLEHLDTSGVTIREGDVRRSKELHNKDLQKPLTDST